MVEEVPVQGGRHRLDVTSDRSVAHDAEGGPGTVAQVEVDVGIIPEEGFSVGTECEHRRFRDAVLFRKRLLQQQEGGEGEFTVTFAQKTECSFASLGTYSIQCQVYIQFFRVSVQIDHIAKIE
jgi:hypothetical protein